MNIKHLFSNFEKRKISYSLGEPASEEMIHKVEKNIEISFPEQVRLFYSHYNGILVRSPSLEIFSIEKLYRKKIPYILQQ
jgi:cell wall assembly regulator SMI1